MKRELLVTIALAAITWIGGAIWVVSEIKAELHSLERDIARVEASNKELNDKLWTILNQNGDKRVIWFDRSLEGKK